MRRILFSCLVVVSCTPSTEEKLIKNDINDEIQFVDSSRLELNDSIERVFNTIGMVDIESINKNILVDLRYASENNFMNTVLYDTLQKCYLQKEVAERLSDCQKYLDSIRPGYKLKVFDGVRPQNVQWEMWRALDSIPVFRRGKFVSNPAKGSVHNYGAAVDLTIVNDTGEELDMGAGYDDFRKIASPKLEQHFFDLGELSRKQIENRKLLRKVMAYKDFRNIPSEWWHFNAYSRFVTSNRFQMLVSESGSIKWFKMTIPKDSLDNSEIIE